MKTVDRITKDFKTLLAGRRILEIACGDAAFSRAVSPFAEHVLAIDLSLERAVKHAPGKERKNIEFKEMDASRLDLDSGTFDVAVSFNALGHLEEILPACIREMCRVVRIEGHIIFLATWKMDKALFGKIRKMSALKDTSLKISETRNAAYHSSVWKKTKTVSSS
ncbi:MAG: class I SAM-dependent methyltransferase [Planctomycetota bacterium]|jgi:ubiquinone/menaquinone biosynthesis C-methylase UbiE